jgi:3-phosphoshikimate 1-carboxyvinyltransferase
MGIEAEELDDGLVVVGGQARQQGEVHAPHDHRIAMAFAVAGLASPQGCALTGAESVQTSYPEFFQTMDRLTGGRR